MRTSLIIAISIFLILYGSINYYIGLRGWQAFGRLLPHSAIIIYWGVIVLASSSMLISRLGGKYLPELLSDSLTIIGSYWLAFMVYSFLALIVVDLIRIINRWLHFLPDSSIFFPAAAGMLIFLLIAGLITYGVWNAQKPRISRYDVEINKEAAGLQQLRVVVVSDIHMSKIIDKKRVRVMADLINELNPDLILLPGDIIDGNLGPFVRQNMREELELLKPKYGTFAVFGNHDLMGGIATESESLLREAGVTVLRDTYQLVDGSFYVVGRDDISGDHINGRPRQSLAEVMDGVNRAMPVLLLDHQPYRLEEGEQQGVDLQLSGHTHHGQLFPFDLITQRIFENDWGYLRKGDYQVIVSCGFGTWGPPVRINSMSEIIDITIIFNP